MNIPSEARIKFSHNYNQKVFDVFEYLLEMFEVADLSEAERWLMKQFSVIPSFYYNYEKTNNESILKLLQVESEDYKDEITKSLNRIVEKGWLQWDQKSDAFKMHNLIQEVLRFKLQPLAYDCRDLIQEMFSRMSYQKVNFANRDNQIVKDITQFVKGDSIVFAELLDEYASVSLRLYNYTNSIELQERSLEMKLKVLPQNDIKLADSYNGLALAFLSMGDYEKAIEFQLKDLEITKIHTKEDDYNIAITYNNLSLIYRKTKDFDKASFYQNKAEEIAKKINDVDLDNVIFNNAGNLHYLQKNFSLALKQFEKSLTIRINNNSDELWISEAHANLASALIELSEFEKAKTHLDLAYEVEKRLVPDSSSFADILHWYGVLYFELREYKLALGYFERSLVIYRMGFKEEHFSVVRGEEWVDKIRKLV